MYTLPMNDYQNRQLQMIVSIEESFKHGNSPSSIVEMVSDYTNDMRICLTGVTFLPQSLSEKIVDQVVNPLKEADSRHYFYDSGMLHITINNVRIISDPPNFTEQDIEKVRQVFAEVIPKYQKFNFELKRLFVLPTSIAISAFSPEILKDIALELRHNLTTQGVTDDKIYASNDVVIASTTICRFTTTPSESFFEKVKEIRGIQIGSHLVEKISLITTNAGCVPASTKVIGEFNLTDKI